MKANKTKGENNMKKLLTISILVALVLILACTMVKATTESELEAYSKQTHTIAGKTVKLEADKVVKVERYLSTHDVTDEQATAVKAKIDEAKALLNKAGVADYTKMSRANKQELLKIGQEAAKALGLTMTYNASERRVEIYEGTKMLDSQPISEDILVQTGSNNIVYVVLATVAIIAVAGVAVISVKKAIS